MRIDFSLSSRDHRWVSIGWASGFDTKPCSLLVRMYQVDKNELSAQISLPITHPANRQCGDATTLCRMVDITSLPIASAGRQLVLVVAMSYEV